MSNKWIEILTLALAIAILPPIWAVLAPYIKIETGPVALICAGLFVANGNKYKDALKISIGFLTGDLWSVLSLNIIEKIFSGSSIGVFCTLFILGAIGVIFGSILENFVYLPALLCGWAIGMTVLAPLGVANFGNYPIQIGVAMVVGVVYVGVCVDLFQKFLIRRLEAWKKKNVNQ